MLHNSFSSFQPPVIHQHEEITSVPPAKSIMFLFCIFNGGALASPTPLLKNNGSIGSIFTQQPLGRIPSEHPYLTIMCEELR